MDSVRQRTGLLFETSKDSYIQRIESYLNEGGAQALFKDDLVNLIGLAETKKHLDLIDRYIKTSTEAQRASYGGWSVAIMRLYYLHNDLERAYEAMKSEEYGDFFQRIASYKILMTMLYDAGEYDKVREIYELSRSRLRIEPIEGLNQNSIRTLSVLLFAAYAKQNTPESLKAAEELLAQDPDNTSMERRVKSMMAYLYYNQGRPVDAINIISDHRRVYPPSRELKTLCLLSLGRYEDLLVHLRSSLDAVGTSKIVMTRKTFEAIESKLNSIPDEQIRSALSDFLDESEKGQLVSDQTLEDSVFKPIEERKPREFDMGDRFGGFQGDRVGGFQGDRVGGFQGNRVGGFQRNRVGGFQGNRVGGFQGNRYGDSSSYDPRASRPRFSRND